MKTKKLIETPAPSPMLVPIERIVAGIIGFCIFGWAAYVIFSPPEHKEVISGCKTTGNACVVTVSDIPESVTSLLVAAGVAFLLIAFLGIRFRTVKLPGVELASVQDADPKQASVAQAEGKTAPIPGSGAPNAPPPQTEKIALWSSLPTAVKNRAIDKWQDQSRGGAPWEALIRVDKPMSGSRDWYLHFDDDQVWRATITPGDPPPSG